MPGFMSGRVVVERREDLAKDDLRMMIRNEKNGEGNRERDEEEENLESRRVVVKEVEEMDRQENEMMERRREEEEMIKDDGGRRVVRLEKANGDKAENSDEDAECSRGASSRNGKENTSEGRREMKSPLLKFGSIEPTPDAAKGGKT